MRWWIWLILVLVALALFVMAVVYVVKRGLHLVKGLSSLVEQATPYLDEMQRTPSSDKGPFKPAFTQPLEYSASRYSVKHQAVIERKQHSRNRHAAIWKRWHSQPVPGVNSLEESTIEIR
jgi:predicted PurR-regulated permease PerM